MFIYSCNKVINEQASKKIKIIKCLTNLKNLIENFRLCERGKEVHMKLKEDENVEGSDFLLLNCFPFEILNWRLFYMQLKRKNWIF